MRRDAKLFDRLSLLALVVSVVVGVHLTPRIPPVRASAPTICSFAQRASQDTLKAGQRAEPRVSPAPQADRLPPLPLCQRSRAVAPSDLARLPSAAAYAPPAHDVRIVIAKQVPRLERGDPPRT